MKKYGLLLLFLMSVLGIKAQHFVPDTSAYEKSHVIYATLVTNENYPMNAYEIGAFIGENCRAKSNYETVYGTSQDNSGSCFVIRVWGDDSADAGKEITFKVYNTQTAKEYSVTPASTVTWTAEGTTAMPSNPFQLTLSVATSMSLPETITVKLGETVNLRDYITVTPEGASLPEGAFPWDLGNFSSVASIENDMLTALQVTTGATLYIMDATGLPQYQTTLIITNDATSMTIKDEYKDGVTVNKNDSKELTHIISDCLIIEPENHSNQVEWVIGDETIIARNQEAASYTPIAGGQTTMTARILDDEGNVRLSAVLNVTVVVPVESIELEYPVDAVFANVGDDIGPRVTPIVKVLPEDATNKEVTWSSDDSSVVSVEGTTMTALKSGGTTLVVTSVDNPDVFYEIPVQVFNPARSVTVKNQEINVEYVSGVLDISDIVRQNFEIGPEGYESIESGFINSTDTSTVNTEGSMMSDNGIFVDAKVKRPGTSYITVNLLYTDYNGQRADYRPEYPNAIASGEFTINVIQGLEGFTIQIDEAKRGEASAITITPVPENADIDVSKVTVEVNGLSEMPGEWTFATVASQGDGKNFTVTPNLPGMALVSVLYNDEVISQDEMEVGMPISLTSGWQWLSFPYAFIYPDELLTVFGNELEEIRSQDRLLYNDPQYGYFGTLTQSGLNSRECYKVKMKSSRDYTLTGVSLNLFGDEAALNPGWTWIFNPYFYDRRIADVLQGTFNTGDRIVSKDDGFAEYSGGRWTGTLTLLRAGQGYLYYNAGAEENVLNFAPEAEMAQENAAAGAKQMGMRTEWNYDASAFDGNMNIVAQISAIPNMEDYVIGAYVGDECRGEGIPVDGKLFITVHGTAGERVNFIAHNEATNEFFPIAETVTLQQSLGSVGHPFVMNIGGGATGIDSIRAEFLKGSKSWNLRGVEMPVNTPQKGVRIIRMADGKTIKTTK